MGLMRHSGLVMVVLLASCSAGLSASERDGFTVVISNDTSTGMTALMGGTLVVEGGTGVEAPGIGTVLLGEDFTGGGGEAGAASLEIPEPCAAGNEPVMLLNSRK